MINFTDVNPTLFASDGSFFYGKLVFLYPGTTDPKQVYDKDGVVYSSNVVTTDTHGRMEIQVFLDGAYDVQFWKLVGTQFDIDDPTQWAFDREMRVLDPTKATLEISGDAIVGTIEDLRGVDNAADGATMTVMGYYSAGDMTPQYYYWNPNVADNDDGGSVICPEGRTGAGRWLMIPQRVVDVRAFGVKPSQQANTAAVTGNVAGAFNFANRYNRELWFPKVYSSEQYSQQVYSYYVFNGGILQLLNNDLFIDNCVRFLSNTGYTTINAHDIVKKDELFIDNGSGRFIVVSDSMHFMWDGPNLTWSVRKRVIIDANHPVSQNKTWSFSNKDVILEASCNASYSFNQCRFSGYAHLPIPVSKEQSFISCKFSDKLYDNSNPTGEAIVYKALLTGVLTLTDCEIAGADEFDLPVNYLYSILKNQTSANDKTADLLGLKVVSYGTPETFEKIQVDKILVNNAEFSSELLASTCENSVEYLYKNCVFRSSPSTSQVAIKASFEDCEILGSANEFLILDEGAVVKNCKVGVQLGLYDNAKVVGCIFENTVDVSCAVSLVDCNFTKVVSILGSIDEDKCVIENAFVERCLFTEWLELRTNGSRPLHLQGLYIKGNFFLNGSHSIELANGTSFDNGDQEYLYEGNHGPKAPNNTNSGRIVRDASHNGWISAGNPTGTNANFVVTVNPNNRLPIINLFALGKRTFIFTLEGFVGYGASKRYYRFSVSQSFSVNGSGFASFNTGNLALGCSVVTDFSQDNHPGIIETLGTFSDKFWMYPSLNWIDAEKFAFTWSLKEIR